MISQQLSFLSSLSSSLNYELFLIQMEIFLFLNQTLYLNQAQLSQEQFLVFFKKFMPYFLLKFAKQLLFYLSFLQKEYDLETMFLLSYCLILFQFLILILILNLISNLNLNVYAIQSCLHPFSNAFLFSLSFPLQLDHLFLVLFGAPFYLGL